MYTQSIEDYLKTIYGNLALLGLLVGGPAIIGAWIGVLPRRQRWLCSF